MILGGKKVLKKSIACVLSSALVMSGVSMVPMQASVVKAATTSVYSMTATQGPVLTAEASGGVGFTYPIFNGNSSITYQMVADDISLHIKSVNSNNWVCIDGNASSGWVYNQNYGQFWDGPGGYWFTLTESVNVKLVSKSTGASLVYTLNYESQNQNQNKGAYALSAFESDTTYTADGNGALAFVLPKVGGKDATESDINKFVFEIKINGSWVELADYSKSTFAYVGTGYNNTSEKNQWGYWYVDGDLFFHATSDQWYTTATNKSGAPFADLHYKVNNGGQLNVAMVKQSDGSFKYTLKGINAGDKVEYFFTYNPGTGAKDTAWQTYTMK